MKNFFFMQMLQLHINENGSAWADMGRQLFIASANKGCSTILNNKSLRIELSIDRNHLQSNGGSCNKPIPEVDFGRQRFKIFKNL